MFKGHTFEKISKNNVKGGNGTIVIIGGSKLYTGAPIFAALGALRSGSDLVYIFTSRDSVNNIKTLREAIVTEVKFNKRILDKATACIIGPGLGRINDRNLKEIIKITNYLDSRNIPIILDADAIHLYKKGYFRKMKDILVTPNHNEAINLNIEPNHLCIYKGKVDVIKYGDSIINIETESSIKRCGGQGDILTGILATSCSINKEDLLEAAISASKLTRLATSLAFKEREFSMITSDIFDNITVALKEIMKKR